MFTITPSGELKVIPSIMNQIFQTFFLELYTTQSPAKDTYHARVSWQPEISMISQYPIWNTRSCERDGSAFKTMWARTFDQANAKWQGPGSRRLAYSFIKNSLINPSSFKNGQLLSGTLTDTSITLLLKPGKENSNCISSCPICLLNVDNKILANVLALRLEPIMPLIISSNQTGFYRRPTHLF